MMVYVREVFLIWISTNVLLGAWLIWRRVVAPSLVNKWRHAGHHAT
jgi:hypothetical protein